MLGRAVVLLQADDPRAGKLLFKAEDVGDVRAPEAVDALIIVAHHTDVLPRAGEQRGQPVLQGVGVLILVDEDVAEFAAVVVPHLRHGLQQADGVPQQVIEVQRVGFAEFSIVKRIHFTYVDFAEVVDLTPLGLEFLRRLAVVLGAGDDRLDLAGREGLFLQPQLLENILDHALAVIGVIDGKAAIKAQSVDVTAQDADAGGMERGGPHVGGGLLP